MRENDPVAWWAAIDTESVSDSGSSNTVMIVSVGLILFGVALLGVTVWFWRVTRPDPDALGPLAVMSDRDFFRRGPIEQRRSLDVARPGKKAIDEPVLESEPNPILVVESDEERGEVAVEIAGETFTEQFDDEEDLEPDDIGEAEVADTVEPAVLDESDDGPSRPSLPRSIDPLL